MADIDGEEVVDTERVADEEPEWLSDRDAEELKDELGLLVMELVPDRVLVTLWVDDTEAVCDPLVLLEEDAVDDWDPLVLLVADREDDCDPLALLEADAVDDCDPLWLLVIDAVPD